MERKLRLEFSFLEFFPRVHTILNVMIFKTKDLACAILAMMPFITKFAKFMMHKAHAHV